MNLSMSVEDNEHGGMSVLSLAHLGDAVYELLVRQHVIENNTDKKAGILHKETTALVCASAQAKAYDLISPLLTERELNVMKRGRNSNTPRIPKNADCIAYRKATGVEALFGYLYFCGETGRINELFAHIINAGDDR